MFAAGLSSSSLSPSSPASHTGFQGQGPTAMSSTCDLQLDLIKKFLRRSPSSITPRAVPNGIDPRLGFPFMVFGAAILHPLIAKDAFQMLLSVEKDRCKSPTNLVGAPPHDPRPEKKIGSCRSVFLPVRFRRGAGRGGCSSSDAAGCSVQAAGGTSPLHCLGLICRS